MRGARALRGARLCADGQSRALLFTPVRANGAARLMPALAASYAKHLVAAYGQEEALGKNLRRLAVHARRHLLACMRYIEENPVRAGLAVHPGAMLSSYRCNALGKMTRSSRRTRTTIRWDARRWRGTQPTRLCSRSLQLHARRLYHFRPELVVAPDPCGKLFGTAAVGDAALASRLSFISGVVRMAAALRWMRATSGAGMPAGPAARTRNRFS